MRSVRENLTSAGRAMAENWLRTILTMLGMVIGVGSVVLLVGIGQGVKEDVNKQIESLGADVAIILPGKLDKSGQPNLMATLGITTLTERDVASVRAIPGVVRAAPLLFIGGTIEHDGRAYSALVIATEPGMHPILKRPLLAGRFFGPNEMRDAVCVMSFEPKQDVFGSRPALRQTITIRDRPFSVIGVYSKEEESLFAQFSTAQVVYLPSTAAREMFHGGQINRILVQVDPAKKPDPILASIRETLIRNHGGKEDFGILDARKILRAINRLSDIVTTLVACIGAISLVVAGIGIMNIMLVTVTERTREIGVRKAVGAARRDIFLQFLTEAIVLSFAGGAVGTLVAGGICAALARTTPLKPLITPSAVAIAFSVCVAVGLVFGMTPAVRAASQDPIEALRHE